MSWVSSENKFAPLFYRFFKIFFSWIINRTNKYEKVFALGVEESQYLRRIGINEKKIELLPHGYNENTMFYSKESRAKLKEHYMIDDDKIIISYIGKFNNYKEPDLIFDIAARLPPKIKNRVILYFIGFKSDEYMKKFNKKLNIYSEFDVLVDEGVPFTQLHKYFSMSDICIFPKETTLSSIHAQVCGCEVIMENHDSNKERVVNQDNLYNIDDLDQAASILERIIINKEYLNRNKYIDELKNREYSNQVKKLRQLIIDKRKEKK